MNDNGLHISQEQVEKLAELGYRLQQTRQDQRMTLEQVAAKSMVPIRLLKAIEEANWQQLPEPVYIQGFLRRYAEALGLNGSEWSKSFPADAPLIPVRRSMWRLGMQPQLRPLHLYVAYLGLVMSAVSGLSYFLNRATPQPTVVVSPMPTQLAVAGPPAPANVAINSAALGSTIVASNQANPASPVTDKAVKVGVTITDQSWVRVLTDGKMEFEGVMTQGTQQSWQASKEITVRAGNAGGVMVSLNNDKPKPLGDPGDVKEVTFGEQGKTAEPSTISLTHDLMQPTLAVANLGGL